MEDTKFVKVISIGASCEENVCIVNRASIDYFEVVNYFEDDFAFGTLFLKNGKEILVSEDGVEELQKDLLMTTIPKDKNYKKDIGIEDLDVILKPNSFWNKKISLKERLNVLQYLTNNYKEEIAKRIKLMSYNDFLTTLYWKAISTYMKIITKKCEICGSTFELHTHHKTYINHGYEFEHLEDLQVVCGTCHLDLHKEIKK